MPNDAPKLRFFIRNPEGETCWAYCGDMEDRGALALALGHFIVNDIESFPQDPYEFEIESKLMTNAEVAALPDM